MKKVFQNSFLFSLLSLSMIKFSSAYVPMSGNFLQDGMGRFLDMILQLATPVFELALGAGDSSEFFMAKALLLILIFLVVYGVLKNVDLFSNNAFSRFIVALVVSLLSIRYLPENDLIRGVILPYTALGLAITTFLPFLIFFFFVHKSVPGGFGRRDAWAVYAVFFLVLWYERSSDLGIANTIFTIALILVIISFIFDKSIHKYFQYSDFERAKEGIAQSARLKALEEYNLAMEVLRRQPNNRDALAVVKRTQKILSN